MSYWDTFRITKPGPAYLGLCETIAEGIRTGALPPGKKLPSHRLLARKLGLAVGTVTHAYEEAVRRGLVQGQVGQGSFVGHFVSWELSVVSSLRIPPDCLDLYQNKPVAIPEVETPSWAMALEAIGRNAGFSDVARASWSETTPRRQRAGAAWIARLGLQPQPERVVDCPGVFSAMGAILSAVTKPRDLILTAALSHAFVKMLAEYHSLRIAGLPMDEEGILPQALDEICAQDNGARVLYCNPTLHSPTAATMSEARRREIALIAERRDLTIVEDESAAFLSSRPVLPIAVFAPHRTFLIAETWMALSLGLRTAYVLVPEVAAKPFSRALAAGSGTAVSLLAEVAAEWIENGAADRLIAARRAELAPRNGIARRVFAGHSMAGDRHGHHVWLRMPEGLRSDVFVRRAFDVGVAIHPPEWFAVSPRPPMRGVRISLGNAPDRGSLREALGRLVDVLASLRPAAVKSKRSEARSGSRSRPRTSPPGA